MRGGEFDSMAASRRNLNHHLIPSRMTDSTVKSEIPKLPKDIQKARSFFRKKKHKQACSSSSSSFRFPVVISIPYLTFLFSSRIFSSFCF